MNVFEVIDDRSNSDMRKIMVREGGAEIYTFVLLYNDIEYDPVKGYSLLIAIVKDEKHLETVKLSMGSCYDCFDIISKSRKMLTNR